MEQQRAGREAYQAEQDLNAQRDMALWALAMLIVSAVTALLTLWALWYVRGTLAATREALKDTGNATEAMIKQNELTAAAQRAWVDFDMEVEAYYRFDSNAGSITANVALRNTGKSVARNVNRRSGAIVVSKINNIVRNNTCPKLTTTLTTKAILPGDTETSLYLPVDFSFDDLADLGKSASIWIYMVIRIEYEFDGGQGCTQRGFLVSRPMTAQILAGDDEIAGRELAVVRSGAWDEIY